MKISAGTTPVSLRNTEKLELPSISQVHSRGVVESSWYSSQYAPRPPVSSERLPALPQIQPQVSSSSTSSSPRGESFGSSSVYNGSNSSHTSYSSVNGHITGLKTPSPEQTHQSLTRAGPPLNAHQRPESPYHHHHQQPHSQQHGHHEYGYGGADSYGSMNHNPYTDLPHQSHMNHAQGHPPSSGPPPTMAPYSHYSQPPILQPGHQTYQSAQPPYGQYPYSHSVAQPQSSGHPVSSSMSGALVPPQPLPLPGKNSLNIP